MLETAQAARELAPEEVAPLLDDGIAVLQGVADGGDPAAMQDFDSTPIHAYDLENCAVGVVGGDRHGLRLRGAAAEIPTGDHSFEMTNSGAEFHVMVILAKAEGVTESWDDIMAAARTRASTRRWAVRSLRPAPAGMSSSTCPPATTWPCARSRPARR